MKKVTISFMVDYDGDPVQRIIDSYQVLDDFVESLFGSKAEIVLLDATPDLNDVYEFRGYYIPTRMQGSLQAYIKEHRPPGHFLRAVLNNDLTEAIARADEENLRNLPAYVYYLYNEAPGTCWGSPQKVRQWLKREK